MDKKVKRLFISMIITFILVFSSIPLWEYASGKKGAILAQSNNDLKITVVIGEFPQLLIIEDDRALDYIKPTKLSLRNKNDEEKKCELLMLIDKKSTIDYNYIRISVDNKIYKLNELVKVEDNENYYFVLGEYSIKAYSDKLVEVRLWLGEETDKITAESSLTTNFITR